MKTLNFLPKIFLVLSIFLAAIACTEDSSADEITINEITDAVTKGQWIISKFEDSGEDETSDFQGYKFTFAPSGSLTATNGTTTYVGTWSVSDSNVDDDNPEDLHFNIFFELTNQFEDLNDDWLIISNTDTKIELFDESGGDGDVDYLNFQKN